MRCSDFQLQSVMKLITAAAVFDMHDHNKLSLDESIHLTPSDLSPDPRICQRDHKQRHGSQSILPLVQRAVIDSDSTAVDRILLKIGGPVVVQDFLTRAGLPIYESTRNERDVQAHSVGLNGRRGLLTLK